MSKPESFMKTIKSTFHRVLLGEYGNIEYHQDSLVDPMTRWCASNHGIEISKEEEKRHFPI